MSSSNKLVTLAWVALLVPFVLIIWNRRSKATPSAGSGFRLPSLLLPIASLFWGRDLIEEIYNRQKNADEPYILPGILGSEVVLPASWISWLASKPESILSGKWSRIQRMNFDKTFMHAEIVTNPIHEAVIRRDLIANLDKLAPELADEIAAAVDELWGRDCDNYTTVGLEETVFRIVARASTRVFAGKSVSRDGIFIENSVRFTLVVITNGFLMKVIPKALEPFLVWIFVSFVRSHYFKLARVLEPLFQNTALPKSTSGVSRDGNPEDSRHNEVTAVPWLINNATKEAGRDTKEKTPKYLALRLAALMFAAVDTTSLTSINMLLDIFSEDRGGPLVSALREESERNSKLADGKWDRSRLQNMPYSDSALRESMRLSGFAIKLLQRKVMAPEGVILPNGTVLAQGTMLCVSAWGLHHDERLYTEPEVFSPQRFLAGTSSDEETDTSLPKSSERKGVLARTALEADPTFIFWGLGKQSCPGRYIAVDLIKILLSYIVTNYDIVPFKERPKNKWIEYNYIPPSHAKLQVRRRRAHTNNE